MNTVPRLIALALTAVLLAGCGGFGGGENPIARALTWFGYVGGDDIRAGCRAGGADRLRFVYNAVWGEQVRTYDVARSADGAGVLHSRAFGRVSLSRFQLGDPTRPWRGDSATAPLSAAAVSRIEAALRQSGFDRPPPAGRWLRSDEYYWAVSACRQGSFHFNAWNTDSPDLLRLPFLAALLPFDATGVPVRPARQLELTMFEDDDYRAFKSGADQAQRFRLQVGERGLKTGGF